MHITIHSISINIWHKKTYIYIYTCIYQISKIYACIASFPASQTRSPCIGPWAYHGPSHCCKGNDEESRS